MTDAPKNGVRYTIHGIGNLPIGDAAPAMRAAKPISERGYLADDIAYTLISKEHWHRIQDWLRSKSLREEFDTLNCSMLPIGVEQLTSGSVHYYPPGKKHGYSWDGAELVEHQRKYNYALSELSEGAWNELKQLMGACPDDYDDKDFLEVLKAGE